MNEYSKWITFKSITLSERCQIQRTETEPDAVVLASIPHVLNLVESFSQRISLIRKNENVWKQRKTVKGDQITTTRSLSVIKDLQFFLKGYGRYSEPHPVSSLTDTATPTRWEKLATRWPDRTRGRSCRNSENWPQRNGNKQTLELKTNCT